MFSRSPDSTALRTRRYDKLLNRKSIWRTKIQEFLERNSNSNQRRLEAKFQRIRLHFRSSLAEIMITRHGQIIVQAEKSKWRHILSNKEEVVITTAVSEVETRFQELNLCFRVRRGQRNTDGQRNMHVCYRIQKWRCRDRKYLQLRLRARQRRDSGGYAQVFEDAQKNGTLTDNEM